MKTWDDLTYWSSGEWQVIEEKLDDLKRNGTNICPSRRNLFTALTCVPFDEVRVAIIGQDPYPDPAYATGCAFSIPKDVLDFPPTLGNILKEYVNDLHYPPPASGDLSPWCDQGVLLWNAIPSCEAFKPASHRSWEEWKLLSQEIVRCLSDRAPIVFCFLGSIAGTYRKFVNEVDNIAISVGHPSPRGILNSNNPFLGSRVFSRINDSLVSLKQPAIDWRLP